MLSKTILPILFAGIVIFAAGCLVGLFIHSAINASGTTEFDSDVSDSGVFLRAWIPEEIVRGEPYEIRLVIEELEGQPRTITGLRVEGRMLTRALQSLTTEPLSPEGRGNIADGWWEASYSLPLRARSALPITIFAESRRAGPAHGTIIVSFDDGSESSIPIRYEITEP